MKKATPPIERVREHSRKLVYNCLLERPGERLSRNDISRTTGLSNPTVSTVLQEFLALSLIHEVGQSAARGGRPAQLVSLNPRASCVMSVDLSDDGARALLVDLTGSVLEREEGPSFGQADTEELFAWLAMLHSRWGASYRLGRLAVALPGVVEHGSGTVYLAPALGWNNYPLAERLEKQLGLPVTLENDVNALAMGELRYGGFEPFESALFLSITSGVGMGLVLEGRVFRGSHFAAGEVGYSRLPGVTGPAEPKLGESGPLESHLLSLARSFLRKDHLELTEPAAQADFDRFADDLATIVLNAVCLLNPERLAVAWPADRDQRLLQALRSRLNPPMPLQISSTRLGRDASGLGVAAIALDELADAFCSLSEQGAF